jgi:hypothetical protein
MAAMNGWVKDRDAREDELVRLRFWVKQTNQDELKERLKRVSDPRSPEYGHYMTKEQVDALTAPREEDVVVVEKALNGYAIHKQNKGAVISVEVPISFAEHTLGGNYVYYCRSDITGASELQSCALRNPTADVPAALRAACDIITPLDDPLDPLLSGPVHGPIMAPGRGPMPLVASAAIASVATDTSQTAANDGCCYSIGFGDLMKPCCLTTTRGSSNACNVGKRLGGQTGFSETACPATPEDAQQMLRSGRLSEAAQTVNNKQSTINLPEGHVLSTSHTAISSPSDASKGDSSSAQSASQSASGFSIVTVGAVAATGLIAAAVVIKRSQRRNGASPLLVAE